jgi:preprotein translocase subunit Sec61beta
MVKKKTKRAKKGGKKEAPGPFTAAGLVRFYEESDVGVKVKPQTFVIISLAFAIVILILDKLYTF